MQVKFTCAFFFLILFNISLYTFGYPSECKIEGQCLQELSDCLEVVKERELLNHIFPATTSEVHQMCLTHETDLRCPPHWQRNCSVSSSVNVTPDINWTTDDLHKDFCTGYPSGYWFMSISCAFTNNPKFMRCANNFLNQSFFSPQRTQFFDQKICYGRRKALRKCVRKQGRANGCRNRMITNTVPVQFQFSCQECPFKRIPKSNTGTHSFLHVSHFVVYLSQLWSLDRLM